MNPSIPKRLRKEPLIEAIWQVQFEPQPDQPAAEILPGLLYTAMRDEYAQLQLRRLPAADIPAPMAALDPSLRHSAKYRIESPESSFLAQVGDRVVTFNCRRPYSGWAAFKDKILVLIGHLDRSGLIPQPQRHSLRYIDLLTLEEPPSLKSLQMSLSLGSLTVGANPLQMRVELSEAGRCHVLQVVTPAQVRLPDENVAGTLIDLETIAEIPEMSWSHIRQGLDDLHTASKNMFFENLLTSEAISQLGPEY